MSGRKLRQSRLGLFVEDEVEVGVEHCFPVLT
jgi:hypothetical protein